MRLQQHFSLKRLPFPKAATKKTLLLNSAMKKALKWLNYALVRDTIALLVAESGCGKSTLIFQFAQKLDAANYQVLCTSFTTLQPFSFITHLTTSLGLNGFRYKGEAAAGLIMHLRSQPKRTVIIIDEGHLLPDNSLEDLRLLTVADHFDQQSPFSLVLVGQPLLRDRMAQPQHYALWQRIGVRLRLPPLNENEIGPFLETQIKAAGGDKKNIFDKSAVTEIFHHSRGIPRLVQTIALNSMFAAMSDDKKIVDAQAVQQAMMDLEAN